MKKLLALALTALMLVCAIAPAMAADEALPELFEGADSSNLCTIYDGLLAADPSAFPAGEVLYRFFAWDLSGMGIPGVQGGIMAFADCEYPVEFEVADDGKYAFNVSLANYDTAGAVTVKIYDAAGDMLAEEVITPDGLELGKMYYYTLAAELDLVAGEFYTATFSGANAGDGGNSIICDFYYALTEPAEDTSAEDTSADDTSADDTTTAAPTEDTSATQGGEQTAPATFDVAVIALAVAGASAAVAVVSKKRR